MTPTKKYFTNINHYKRSVSEDSANELDTLETLDKEAVKDFLDYTEANPLLPNIVELHHAGNDLKYQKYSLKWYQANYMHLGFMRSKSTLNRLKDVFNSTVMRKVDSDLETVRSFVERVSFTDEEQSRFENFLSKNHPNFKPEFSANANRIDSGNILDLRNEMTESQVTKEKMVNLKKYEEELISQNSYKVDGKQNGNNEKWVKERTKLNTRKLEFYLKFPERKFDIPKTFEDIEYAINFCHSMLALTQQNKYYVSINQIETGIKEFSTMTPEVGKLHHSIISKIASNYKIKEVTKSNDSQIQKTEEITLSEQKYFIGDFLDEATKLKGVDEKTTYRIRNFLYPSDVTAEMKTAIGLLPDPERSAAIYKIIKDHSTGDTISNKKLKAAIEKIIKFINESGKEGQVSKEIENKCRTAKDLLKVAYLKIGDDTFNSMLKSFNSSDHDYFLMCYFCKDEIFELRKNVQGKTGDEEKQKKDFLEIKTLAHSRFLNVEIVEQAYIMNYLNQSELTNQAVQINTTPQEKTVEPQPKKPENEEALLIAKLEKIHTFFEEISTILSFGPTVEQVLEFMESEIELGNSKTIDIILRRIEESYDKVGQIIPGKAKKAIHSLINQFPELKPAKVESFEVSKDMMNWCRACKSTIDQMKSESNQKYYNTLKRVGISEYEDFILGLNRFFAKPESMHKSYDDLKPSFPKGIEESKEWLATLPPIEQEYVKNYLGENSGKVTAAENAGLVSGYESTTNPKNVTESKEKLSLTEKIERAVNYYTKDYVGARSFSHFTQFVVCFDQSVLYSTNLIYGLTSKNFPEAADLDKTSSNEWDKLFPNEQKQIEDAFKKLQGESSSVEKKEDNKFLDFRDYAEQFESIKENTEGNIGSVQKKLKIFNLLPIELKQGLELIDFKTTIQALLLITILYGYYQDSKNNYKGSKIQHSKINTEFNSQLSVSDFTYSLKADLNYKSEVGESYKTREELNSIEGEKKLVKFITSENFPRIDAEILELALTEILTNPDRTEFDEMIAKLKTDSSKSRKSAVSQVLRIIKDIEGSATQSLEEKYEQTDSGNSVGGNQPPIKPPTGGNDSSDSWDEEGDDEESGEEVKSEYTPESENEPEGFDEADFVDDDEGMSDEDWKAVIEEANELNEESIWDIEITDPVLRLMVAIVKFKKEYEGILKLKESGDTAAYNREINKLLKRIGVIGNETRQVVYKRRLNYQSEVKKESETQNYIVTELDTNLWGKKGENGDKAKKQGGSLPTKKTLFIGSDGKLEVEKDTSEYIESIETQILSLGVKAERINYQGDSVTVFFTENGLALIAQPKKPIQIMYDPSFGIEYYKMLFADDFVGRITPEVLQEYCFFNNFKYLIKQHKNTTDEQGNSTDELWKKEQTQLIKNPENFKGWSINITSKDYEPSTISELKKVGLSFEAVSALFNLMQEYNVQSELDLSITNAKGQIMLTKLRKLVDGFKFKGETDGKSDKLVEAPKTLVELIDSNNSISDNPFVNDYLQSLIGWFDYVDRLGNMYNQNITQLKKLSKVEFKEDEVAKKVAKELSSDIVKKLTSFAQIFPQARSYQSEKGLGLYQTAKTETGSNNSPTTLDDVQLTLSNAYRSALRMSLQLLK